MEYTSRGSAESKTVWIIVVGLIVATLGFVIYSFWPNLGTTPISVGSKTFHAQVARTSEQREKGLSNTHKLGDRSALLMVYEYDSEWGIWMKDMKYPIDVLWLDKDKKVVHMIKNMQPKSYPRVYKPEQKARYVLELPTDTLMRYGVTAAQTIGFTLDGDDA